MRLAVIRSVWAMDTPGYGLSDSLDVAEPSAGDYAEALAETLHHADLTPTDLYGSHTGAKIALELAVRHPSRVRRLVLDGIGLYSADEQRDLLENYTPSLVPDAQGTHLQRYWHMQRDMHVYWPWYRASPETSMGRALPDARELHDQVVDFLLAGDHYWKGYKAAFRHDTATALAALTVPTLILASSRDPLRAHLARFAESTTITVAGPAPDDDPIDGPATRIRDFLEA